MGSEVERQVLSGDRCVLTFGDAGYPEGLSRTSRPPKRLYVCGNPDALKEGLAIVGARKATPYGIACAERFARMAGERGIPVISGGARGCDAAAHRAALDSGGVTVAFLGGGCDRPYPAEHVGLFQRIIDQGGAIVSEHPWNAPPLPRQFRTRNRLIASLAKATLIVEAGLPSGTFSTADEALAASRDVLVVPGAITSHNSRGANRLLYQGASPIVDDESFEDALLMLFGSLKQEKVKGEGVGAEGCGSARSSRERLAVEGACAALDANDPIVCALRAEPLGMEALYRIAAASAGEEDPRAWLMSRLADGERAGAFARYPDGRWGPALLDR